MNTSSSNGEQVDISYGSVRLIVRPSHDSKEGVAQYVPHTAFVDPTTPKDAPLRQSIEIRALVFY
jgi:hypothetical protein